MGRIPIQCSDQECQIKILRKASSPSQTETDRYRSSRLPIIPASFFGIVLGLSGLGTAWRIAHDVWNLPSIVGEGLVWLAVIVWATLTALYGLKWLLHCETAVAEVRHPVQCCFVGLVGVATMLIAGGLLPYSRPIAIILFSLGATFTLAFAIWRTGGLWHGERDQEMSTPVLYLPTVGGSFVAATVGAALGYDWGQLAFGAGLFSWLAIESVLIHRLLTAPALAAALRPTLGIQLAPAPVGAVSYLSVTQGSPDVFVHALIGYALLQACVLIRLMPWIWQKSFTASYWAFTFGVTALAIAPLRLVQRGDVSAAAQLAPFTFIAANLIVGSIFLASVSVTARGPLLPKALRTD